MREGIKYAKEIFINNKIIHESDILQFAKIVDELYSDDDYKKEFIVYFADDSTISGDKIDVFKTDEFNRRVSVCIKMEYYSKELKNHLEINLYNTIKYKPISKINITSIDKTWYECTLQRINTTVDEIQNQSKLALLDSVFGCGSLPLILSTIFSLVVSELVFKIFPVIDTQKSTHYLIYFSILIASILLFYKIILDIIKMFPKLEFAFGIQYNRNGEKLKRLWGWVITTILIPVVLQIISLVI